MAHLVVPLIEIMHDVIRVQPLVWLSETWPIHIILVDWLSFFCWKKKTIVMDIISDQAAFENPSRSVVHFSALWGERGLDTVKECKKDTKIQHGILGWTIIWISTLVIILLFSPAQTTVVFSPVISLSLSLSLSLSPPLSLSFSLSLTHLVHLLFKLTKGWYWLLLHAPHTISML